MAKYKFKGYTITNCGYHRPDHCVWWEAVNENGEACFYGNTLREVEFEILDYEWEQKMNKKDEEIERLKHEKIEVEANALACGGIVEAARHKPVGNAAAMREALMLYRKLFEDGVICTSYANSAAEMDELEELYHKTSAALSAPPRQRS